MSKFSRGVLYIVQRELSGKVVAGGKKGHAVVCMGTKILCNSDTRITPQNGAYTGCEVALSQPLTSEELKPA